MNRTKPITTWLCALCAFALLVAACGTEDDASESVASTSTAATVSETTGSDTAESETTDGIGDTGQATFTAEIWADNWFALYINGELVGEDSVPITTERSFNAETITFEATYPLTIAIEAKDFKETDSGLEYIGEPNQQMGDGGIIAQITDNSSGDVVAVTNSSWSSLVVHSAPLNTECEKDADPDATCEYEIVESPSDWFSSDFDDSGWEPATEWSAADVGPKDGYDEINWDGSAQLIWGDDLEVDNTVLLRLVVAQ